MLFQAQKRRKGKGGLEMSGVCMVFGDQFDGFRAFLSYIPSPSHYSHPLLQPFPLLKSGRVLQNIAYSFGKPILPSRPLAACFIQAFPQACHYPLFIFVAGGA